MNFETIIFLFGLICFAVSAVMGMIIRQAYYEVEDEIEKINKRLDFLERLKNNK